MCLLDTDEDRRGGWESLTRDSERFRRRVVNLSSTLAHALDGEHRRRVYDARFRDGVDSLVGH